MRSTLVCSFLFSLALPTLSPQASAQKVELFGGYSYLRPAVPAVVTIVCPQPPCPSTTTNYYPDLHGWEFAGTFKPGRIIGITADFSGHYGSLLGTSMHEQTYLFGPKITLPFGLYVHALAGDAHQSFNGGGGDAFAAAVGGGFDLKLIPFLSLRLIQVDYVYTHFHSDSQHQPRISAGLVLRL